MWCGPSSFTNMSFNRHENNWADTHAGLLVIFGGVVTIENEIYKNNSCGYLGIINIGFQSTAYFKNVWLENSISYYKAGGFAINEYSNIYVNNMTITNSVSLERAGAIYISENTYLRAKNLIVKNCFSNIGSVILANDNYLSLIVFESCLFVNNSAEKSQIDSLFNVFYFIDCQFIGNKNELFFLEETKLILINSSILDLKDRIKECFVISSTNSTIVLENIIIEDVVTSSKSACIVAFNSNFSISKTFLFNIIQITSSIYMMDSICNIVDVKFINNFPSSLYIENSLAVLKSLIFEKNFNNEKKFLSCMILVNNRDIKISDSFFNTAVSTNEGACINAKNTKINLDEKFSITNCTFFSSASKMQGGSLYFRDVSVNLTGSNFTNNSASEGGCIYYKVNSGMYSSFKIDHSIFLNNTSTLGGGAIMWFNVAPVIDNQTVFFSKNKARYGDNIASNVFRIKVQIYSHSTILNRLELEYDSFLNGSKEYSIENQKAGESINKVLVYEYLDYYNQTISSINNFLETFEVLTQNEYDNLVLDKKFISSDLELKTYILGGNSFPIKDGKLTASSLLIFTKPDSIVYLIMKSSFILQISRYLVNLSNFEFIIKDGYFIMIKIQIRKCIVGEIIKENFCFKCDYSEFSLNTKDKNCKKCPGNAVCKGGAQIILEPQYWRSSNLSDNIIYCHESKDNCLGGADSNCADVFLGHYADLAQTITITLIIDIVLVVLIKYGIFLE